MPRFSEEVCERLGNYVYRLIDPRNGETFYVGKGRNNRVFDHAEGLPEILEDDSQTLGSKLDRIRANGMPVSTSFMLSTAMKYQTLLSLTLKRL